MANLAIIHDEHQHRLETKLKRELGDHLLSFLSDDRTEDILLNPDGSLWLKRMSEGFTRVVGSTGSGKTTFVNACLDALATLTPHDRVISIEDTTELQCPVQNYLDLRAVGNVTMLECLRACMRLKPTRIVVGEVRGAEAHTLLKAWNTGHPGGMATVHANDAMSGLIRLESLVAEAISAPQQTLIAEADDIVVFVDEESNLAAGRKVREVVFVAGSENGQYVSEHV